MWPTPTAKEPRDLQKIKHYLQTGEMRHSPTGYKHPRRLMLEETVIADQMAKDAAEQVQMWPTPSTRDYKGGHGTIVEEDGKYYRVSNTTGTKYGARLDAQVEKMEEEKLWPTPIASSSQSASMEASKREAERLHPKGQNHLAAEMASRTWPTPSTRDYKGGHGTIVEEDGKYYRVSNTTGTKYGARLDAQVEKMEADKTWPTPRSSEWKDTGPVGSKSHTHMDKKGYLCAKTKDPNEPKAALNPDWVEWLMGYAPGYTDPEYTEPMQLEDHLGFESEPDIPRVTTRKEHRVNRLKCLGNSIVPQIMHEIGKAILKDREAEGVK